MSDFDINVERTDNFLAHYGIKGMKWGKRKAEDSGSGDGGGDSKSRVSVDGPRGHSGKITGKDIKEARARIQEKEGEIEARYIARTSKATADYNKNFDYDKRKDAIAKANKEFDDAYDELSNTNDNKIASRMTAGEKVAAGLLIGSYGAAAIGVAASYYGSRR